MNSTAKPKGCVKSDARLGRSLDQLFFNSPAPPQADRTEEALTVDAPPMPPGFERVSPEFLEKFLTPPRLETDSAVDTLLARSDLALQSPSEYTQCVFAMMRSGQGLVHVMRHCGGLRKQIEEVIISTCRPAVIAELRLTTTLELTLVDRALENLASAHLFRAIESMCDAMNPRELTFIERLRRLASEATAEYVEIIRFLKLLGDPRFAGTRGATTVAVQVNQVNTPPSHANPC